MDKYISAEVVQEYLKRVIFGADQKIDRWVDQMPAADVRPVVRGRWLTKEYMYGDSDVGTKDMWVDRLAEPIDYYAYCSICGKNAGYDGGEELVLSNFCPNCGADMRQAAGEQCSPLQEKTEAAGERIATSPSAPRNDGTEDGRCGQRPLREEET